MEPKKFDMTENETGPGLVSKGQRAGFTLLEILVVLGILALLISLVAPAAIRQFGGARNKIALQSIERLAGILDLYKLDVGSYPTTEQGLQALLTKPPGVSNWNGPYLKPEKIPEDPWNHPFIYKIPASQPGRDFDLCSLGQSGREGGTGENAVICNK